MVNTFFVDFDPKVTMAILDTKRLGKQRVEAMQIIEALEGNSKSKTIPNHPATKMWKGYVDALKDYYNCAVQEWIDRGKDNNMDLFELKEDPEYPPWCDNEKIW